MLKHSILFLAFLLVSSTLFTSCEDDDDDFLGNWVKMTASNAIPRSYPMTFTINDVTYVGCGYDEENKDYLKDFWYYDASQDTWTQVEDLPGSVRNKGVGFGINGKGYAGLGFNGDDALSDFYCYTPNSTTAPGEGGTWTQVTDFGVGSDGNTLDALKRYEAIAFAIGDTGYVGTGYDTERLYNDFYKYVPNSDGGYWIAGPAVKGTDRRRGATAFTYDSKGYVVGGYGNEYLENFVAYSPSTGSWEELRDIVDNSNYGYDDDYDDIKRQYGVAFVADGYAYLALGTQSSTWRYNFIRDQWDEFNAFEGTNRKGAIAFTATVTEGGKKVTRGFIGYGDIGSESAYDIWKFVPEDERETSD